MQYYKIQFTLNPKFRGSNDYIKDYHLKIPNEKLFWQEPNFIGSVRNEKIDFEPYILDIELFAKSKIMDLIMEGGPVSGKLIISGKLKTILERYRETGMQFFNINILQKNKIYNDYWILNFYEIDMEYIDFHKTTFVVSKRKSEGGTYLENIDIISLDDLKNKLQDKDKNGYKQLFIERIRIKNNISSDFFALQNVEGGVKYITSEKLKNEIENAGCKGIEFMPIEMKMTEWLQGGEREKLYGKA